MEATSLRDASMAHTLTLAEMAIALVVAAHAGVLAVRLAVSLHQS